MDVKRWYSRYFRGHHLHSKVTDFCTCSAISLFLSVLFFYFLEFKRIICTLLLCDKLKKKKRSPCLFKRKGTFISLSSLARGKFLSLCTCTRSFARANDKKIVRSRDARCNTYESPFNTSLLHNNFNFFNFLKLL